MNFSDTSEVWIAAVLVLGIVIVVIRVVIRKAKRSSPSSSRFDGGAGPYIVPGSDNSSDCSGGGDSGGGDAGGGCD